VSPVAADRRAGDDMFVLAHLSDPHLSPLPRPRLSELASKRLLGYLNWRHSRHRIHRAEVLDAITRDLHAARPDHTAVTGDLVNIALPSEFEAARRWLDALGAPADVSVVPGNHDAYVAAAALDGERHWGPYMRGDNGLSGGAGDDQEGCSSPSPLVGEGRGGGSGGNGTLAPHTATPTPDPSPAEPRYSEGSATQQSDRSRQQPTSVGGGEKIVFPYLRRRGPVALVGLSTAVATPLFMATGELGRAQIARAAKMLGELRDAHAFRVVMIHHPPVAPASAHHKRLIDAAAFREAVAAVGAELIIHGHDHVHALGWLAGNEGRVPVVGVPSASACAGMKHHAAAYNLYAIGGGPGAWSCEVMSRGFSASGAVEEINRFALSWSGHE
jgi:3',5'-cyclic AMP phosphodiesterase CpdA